MCADEFNFVFRGKEIVFAHCRHTRAQIAVFDDNVTVNSTTTIQKHQLAQCRSRS